MNVAGVRKMCGNRKVLDLSGDLLVSEHQCLQLWYRFGHSGLKLKLQRGDAVMLYTLTGPLVMLRWQVPRRGSCTTQTQCFVRQGRCKVTGATWPGCDQTTVTAAIAAEIRTESLTLCATRRNYPSFIQLKCTASLSKKNIMETRYKNKSCNQSEQITVPTRRDRAQNHCY